jgi:hypothetical protein
MKNRFTVFLTIAIFIISAIIVPSALASGESVSFTYAPGIGYFGINADPAFLNNFTDPYLSGREVGSDGLVKSVSTCSSLTDPNCSKMNVFKARTMMPLCLSDLDTNCIEKISAINAAGEAIEVKTGEKFPGVRPQDYVGDPARKLPSGGQAPMVTISGAPHAGGNKYVLIFNHDGILDLRKGPNAEFTPTFTGGIFAVSTKAGSFSVGGALTALPFFEALGKGGAFTGYSQAGDIRQGCLINDANLCAVAEALPLDVTFSVKVRINFKVTSWFSGRLTDPIAKIESANNGNQSVTITAKPASVPKVVRWSKKTELPKELIDFYASLPKPLGGTGDLGAQQTDDPSAWSLMRQLTGYDEQMMKEFLLWLPVIGDKSDYLPTLWTVRSMDAGNNRNNCLSSTSEVLGIVSTNASQYLEGPPTFNSSTSTLEYKVAAPHLKPSGEIFLGTYDLQLRSTAARCLYGFTDAPISATVQVISENGEKQVAVTTVNERDGWLYLSAKGFTFSAPIVNVKLTQEKVVVAPNPTPSASPTPTPTATPTPSAVAKPVAAKTTSINCVKGKTTKKVTAVNPKCPTGYKKK